MTAEDFVRLLRSEKNQLLHSYLDNASGSEVAGRLSDLDCSAVQMEEIRAILNSALTDAFYTILLGLDGAASLGGIQQGYHVQDESGADICTGDGSLEALAYDYFHGDRG